MEAGTKQKARHTQGRAARYKEGRTWSAGVPDHHLAKMPGTSSVLPVHSKRLYIVHSAATA